MLGTFYLHHHRILSDERLLFFSIFFNYCKISVIWYSIYCPSNCEFPCENTHRMVQYAWKVVQADWRHKIAHRVARRLAAHGQESQATERKKSGKHSCTGNGKPADQYIPHHFPNDLFRSGHARTGRSIAVVCKTAKKFFYLFSTVERAQARKRTHNLYRRMRGLTWHLLGSLFRINSLPAVLLSITFAPFVRNKLQQLYFSTWHRWIHICEMFSSQATAERSKWFCSSKMPTDRQTASARC